MDQTPTRRVTRASSRLASMEPKAVSAATEQEAAGEATPQQSTRRTTRSSSRKTDVPTDVDATPVPVRRSTRHSQSQESDAVAPPEPAPKRGRKTRSVMATPVQPTIVEEEESSPAKPVKILEITLSSDEESKEAAPAKEIQFPGNEDVDDEEEGDSTLFNLKPEDMKNLDKELAEKEDEEDDESDAEDDLKAIMDSKRKYAKTEIDGRLFSLRQMDAILDEVEKNNQTEGFLDSNEESKEAAPAKEIQFPGNEDVDDEEEGDSTLFNLKPEDMKNLDKEVAEMEDEEDDESDAEDDLKAIMDSKRKYAKTEIDGRLFSLRQMDAILDEVEKNNQTEGFLDSDEESKEAAPAKEIQFPGNEDVDDEEEGDSTLFNLKPKDMKNLDKELAEMEDEEDDESDAEDDLKAIMDSKRKYAKTEIDGRFFSLRQMDAILDEVEKNNLTEGFLDNIYDDELEGKVYSYSYADLFDDKPEKSDRKRKAESNEKKKDKKKVRFADAEDDDEELEDEEMYDEQEVEAEAEDEEEEEGGPVLLGASADHEKPMSAFEKSRLKMQEKIGKLQEQNLKPRSWELSGEVTGSTRDANSLLSQHLHYDQISKAAPEITIDHTEKLEAMIKQRIKDKAYDDPVRKVKQDEKAERYRPDMEAFLEKKSLTQVYEEAYNKEQNDGDKEEKVDPKKKEIEDDMKELFNLFDALTHYEYTPPSIKPELKIVSNMRSMQKEEVGPMASAETADALVAPEEVTKRVAFEPKAEDEKTKTDKLRERRRKKLKQKKLAASGKTIVRKKISQKAKKAASVAEASTDEKSSKKTKSSTFFSELNAVTASEKIAKTKNKKKKKRVASTKVNASAKFKL
ncbi:hypothetical protein L596_017295 [Steinernema carpocapsae]|uniref:Uncharacterized protein n=1 Tax=Steinernema carpocapsae TaxID=34508 RepID=A0A4U5N1H9_STECR|nr:hypothetical protein L596_017295 [Steinernema carpocapsae]